MIGTDEMLLRHTMKAMDKVFGLPATERKPAICGAQEGSTTDAGSGTGGAGNLSPKTRLEALMLAKMNEERAELCADRPALREFFEMNARFLKEIAQ